MFLFNLSLPEFLALFGVLSSSIVALYLLDRVKKHHKVASLRFFIVLEKAPQYRHRRKLQQPWSLLLELLGVTLLLLAIAQLRLGAPSRSSADHVLILDSSAWMAAQSGRNGRLIDQGRAAAKAYLKSLPASDRVMLIRADALATPATQFETDRSIVQRAIDQTQPSAGVLNIDQALAFAGQTRKLHSERGGEIAFVGAGRVAADQASPVVPANFRFIPVAGPAENTGLRKVGIRRSLTKPDTWDIFVAVKNYGAAPRSVPLVVGFGGAPIGAHRFNLPPGGEDAAAFQYTTRAAGWVEARLLAQEPFSLDDHAVLELPARELLPVTIYSDRPALLKPLFTSLPGVKASFLPVARYTPKSDARIVLLDGFGPSDPPVSDSIWLDPPARKSPIHLSGSATKLKLSGWGPDRTLSAGLRSKDLELEHTQLLRLAPGDIPIAESSSGPLIAARPGKPKSVVFGFNPVLSSLKYELATPLLFANVLRWMAPDIFTAYEFTAGTAGTVNVELDAPADPASIQVISEDRKSLPFTLEGRSLRFFCGSPGIVRIFTEGRELVYSLTLPQAGDTLWKPSGVRTGIPGKADLRPSSRDIWQWLAILGALVLFADWWLFGRSARLRLSPAPSSRGVSWRKAS